MFPPLFWLAEPAGLVVPAEQAALLPLPEGRYQELPLLAPGVLGGTNPHVHGGMWSANQFYLDGANVSDPTTQTFAFNLPLVALQSVAVETHGLPPSHGRALGGAVVLEMRRGDRWFWNGSGTLRYTDERFLVYEKRDCDQDGETDCDPPFTDRFSEQRLSVWAGGPLGDHTQLMVAARGLYSRRSLSWSDPDRPTGEDAWGNDLSTIYPRSRSSLLVASRLDHQLGPNELFVQALADPAVIANMRQRPDVLPSAESMQTQGGVVVVAGHDLDRGSWSHSTRLSGQQLQLHYRSVLREDSTCADPLEKPIGYASTEGYHTGSAGVPDVCVTRRRLGLTQTHAWSGEKLRVELGARGERLSDHTRTPGMTVLTWDDSDRVETWPSEQEQTFDASMLLGAAWVAVDWSPVPRLTVSPSARVDGASMEPWIRRAGLSPALRAELDLSPLRLHAGASRTRAVPTLDLALFQEGAYTQGEVTVGGELQTVRRVGEPLALELPTQDELVLGAALSPGPLVLDLAWVQREGRDFWESREANLLWNDEGTDVIGTRNGAPEEVYRLGARGKGMTYQALVASVDLRTEELWLGGSATWATAQGNLDPRGAEESDLHTPALDIDAQSQWTALPWDRERVVKAYGTLNQPYRWRFGRGGAGAQLGAVYRWESGAPYRLHELNDWHGDYRNYADDEVLRMEALHALDLQAGLVMDTGERDWVLMVECFNALNGRSPIGVEERPTGFGEVTSRQSPRWFRIGTEVRF